MSRHALACLLCLAAGIVALALIASSGSARADWPPNETPDGGAVTIDYSDPKNWPNDPGYGGSWELWSFVPASWQGHVTDENKRLGTGAHVDRAWARTTGDFRVLISVLDSGANWGNDDLTNKWHLNAGELPAPMGCPNADGMKHDVNGDGRFNVQDYTTVSGHALADFKSVCDARIKDANANGILDPQDLIAAFSDGKDDDANGYVDDISGWDFFRNDNDPYDDTGYGHGDGEASGSSGEGNNMRHGIGTCPDCSVQLLRVGDSFLADSSDFGLAAFYAVDSGSSVIQEALGTIDENAIARAAIDYAYANNVIVIASMADENSFHHNLPAAWNHTFTVHAITHDQDSTDTSTTFLNFNNCTNYGAQLMASVPGGACSSEATEKAAGMAGLIYAAALQANIPAPPTGHAGDPNNVRRVTAEEAMQIFIAGIDDLYDPADATDPLKYPTRMGWEQRFGYGRVNARRAVDQVLAGKIPPEVEFRAPTLFEVIHPDRTPMVPIVGRVAFRNRQGDKFGDAVDWTLEWAPGAEPDDAAWKPIAQATMMPMGMDGTLAMWDVSQITVDNPSQGPPDNLVNRYMVTLRLRAKITSADPNLNGLTAVARRPAFIYKDPDLLPGFPIRLGSCESSPKMYDLDGDGKKELIQADSSGAMHAFRPDGTELAGWPVRAKLIPGLDGAKGHSQEEAFVKGMPPISADFRSAILATPAIGDIDGDGKPDVFVADYDGNLYAWHADGSMVNGWPKEVDRSIVAERKKAKHPAAVDDSVFGAPAMANFDADPAMEIVVADGVGEVTVWKGNGTKLPGWPVRVWDTSLPDDMSPNGRQATRIVSSPTLGDLDGDGTPDIVVGTNEDYNDFGRVYAISGKTAQFLPGWPITINSKYVLPVVGSGVPNAGAMADLNGDGKPEIAISGIGGSVQVLDQRGKPVTAPLHGIFPNDQAHYGPKTNATSSVVFVAISNPSFGDLDDDGVLDIHYGLGVLDYLLAAANGGVRHDFQMALGAWDTRSGAFKPGFPQAVEDYQFFLTPLVADVDGDGRSEVVNGSAGYFLHAFRADGTEATGFPKFTGQWIAATPTVGDMDGDGKLELASSTRDGWLYAWHVGGSAKGRIDWDSFHHDARNTGNYDTPLDQGGLKGKSGCSCALGAPSRAPLGLALLVLALVIAARRRVMMGR